jgi:iron complex outermembrane recepter protein
VFGEPFAMSHFIKSLTLGLASGLSLMAAQSAQAQVIVDELITPSPVIAIEKPATSEPVPPSPPATNPPPASIGSSTPTTKIPELTDLPPVSTQATDLMAQDTPTDEPAIKVTGVSLQPTETGVEVKLQTTPGRTLQPVTRVEGNTLIADIENAVLALPEGPGFNASNPVAGVTSVSVMQLDDKTVRVSVVGKQTVPTATVKLSPPVTAQQPIAPEAPEEEEEELVVTGQEQKPGYRVPDASTATKTDTPLRDVPASIQVIPKQVIQDQQATKLEEVLRNVGGLTFGGSGEGAGIDISLRGFNGTPILIDGFRQYGLVGLQNTLETANLERVEVLKGPASILYGEIQPGGVINLVSKQPLPDPFYAGELQVGSRAFVRPRIDFSGPLTTDGKLLYRFNALYERGDSFRDFNTDIQRFYIAPVVSWKINDRTDLTLQLEYLNNRQPFDPGRVASGNKILNTPRDRIIGEPDDYVKSQVLNVGYTFEHRFNENWKIRNAFRYLSRNVFEEFAFPFDFDPATGIVTRNFGGFDIDVESYSLQTNVVGKFATGFIKHTLLFGIDLNQNTDITFAAFDFSNPLPLNIFNPIYGTAPRPPNLRDLPAFVDSQVRDRRLGLYLQDQMTILDNLKVLVGFRYDTVEQTAKLGETLFNPTATEVTQSDSALTPRIGIVYQPIEPVSLYASYSQSFTPNTGFTFGGNILKPERGQGWEAGIKAELLNKKLFATLAYFNITKQNVANATDIPNISVAVGEQSSRGVEFDLSGEILPGWNITAAYAFTDAKVTKDKNLAIIRNRLASIPEHSVSLWTTYEVQRGDLKGLGFGAGFNFIGDRKGDLENSYELDSYFLANAAIFYRRSNWRLAVNFKNIFDVDYVNSSFGTLRNDVGEPFTVIGSFSVEF